MKTARYGAIAAALAGVPTVGIAVEAPGVQASAPRQYTVTMANMSFGRLPAGVKVGDTIVWVNRDTVPHSATARDRSFDIRLGQGQTIRMPVKKAGTFAIYCIYHPAMRATLTVAAS